VFALQYLYACPFGFAGFFDADASVAESLYEVLEAFDFRPVAVALPLLEFSASALRLGGIVISCFGREKRRSRRKERRHRDDICSHSLRHIYQYDMCAEQSNKEVDRLFTHVMSISQDAPSKTRLQTSRANGV
jgi:hypothetical protein